MSRTHPGTLVTFEGGESAGKSTQLAAIARLAHVRGLEVVTCREPGGTTFGERLREALFGMDRAPSPTAELLTFAAARAELVANVIAPALAGGALVLCDRFTDSTLAYQGYGRGIDLQRIAAINEVATGGLRPNLSVLLDLPPTVGHARGVLRDGVDGADYVERETAAFHERVREGFLALAAAEPTRWLVLDAALPAQEVTELAWHRIGALISG